MMIQSKENDWLRQINNNKRFYQQNKMNKKQQELFVSFFEEILEAEQTTISIKKSIRNCLGFNPALLFEIVSGGADVITILQLRNYLCDRIACNERQLYELFERLDWTRQGFISLDDFIIQITPFGQAPANKRNKSGAVTPQVEGHFISLLAEYIQRFRIIEVSRKQVDFIAPYNAFLQIDYARTGLIGLGELERFFRVNDFQIDDFQLRLLLHGLRRRCYIEVNLEVFCENLDPLQFGEYEAYSEEIKQEEESQFLKRSRREEETMRRSRIQSQKIQHEIQKQERRKRAGLQRELQLQGRINRQIQEHQSQKDRYFRRAVLEQDKNIRWNVETGNRFVEEQRLKNIVDHQRNAELASIRNNQLGVKDLLVRSAFRKQDELQASRRAKIYHQQIGLRNQIQRDRQLRKKQYLDGVNHSRRSYEQQMRHERQKIIRQYQLQKLRNRQLNNRPEESYYQSRKNPAQAADIRRNDYENEYQSRIQGGSRSIKRYQPETAERSFGY